MKSLLVRLGISVSFAVGAVAALILFRHAAAGVIAVVILTYLCVLVLVLAVTLNYRRMPWQTVVNDFVDELACRPIREGGSTLFPSTGRWQHPPPQRQLPLRLRAHRRLPRLFPCTEFTVRRHAEARYVVDLICVGPVIEPEVEAPAFSAQEFADCRVPEDGAILRNVSFDQLMSERTTATR